jgi:hypothetical protein
MDNSNSWLMPMPPNMMLEHEARASMDEDGSEAAEADVVSQALAVIQQQSDLIGQLMTKLGSNGNK